MTDAFFPTALQRQFGQASCQWSLTSGSSIPTARAFTPDTEITSTTEGEAILSRRTYFSVTPIDTENRHVTYIEQKRTQLWVRLEPCRIWRAPPSWKHCNNDDAGLLSFSPKNVFGGKKRWNIHWALWAECVIALPTIMTQAPGFEQVEGKRVRGWVHKY